MFVLSERLTFSRAIFALKKKNLNFRLRIFKIFSIETRGLTCDGPFQTVIAYPAVAKAIDIARSAARSARSRHGGHVARHFLRGDGNGRRGRRPVGA